jgi:hypothetical protein
VQKLSSTKELEPTKTVKAPLSDRELELMNGY